MKTTTKAAKTPKAFVGPVMPVAPQVPAPVATALLAMVNAPAALPATPAPATVPAGQVAYTIGAKAVVITGRLTNQRGCTVALKGTTWLEQGHKAPNTRHIVINVLAALGGTFTHEQAVAALAPLKADATLGSGTPASYIRAFVKCGYLVPVAEGAVDYNNFAEEA